MDRDKRWLNAFWKQPSKDLRMNLSFSTAYQPQSDGQIERINEIIEAYLRAFINYTQKRRLGWMVTYCWNGLRQFQALRDRSIAILCWAWLWSRHRTGCNIQSLWKKVVVSTSCMRQSSGYGLIRAVVMVTSVHCVPYLIQQNKNKV
jgi:hypothetical protein